MGCDAQYDAFIPAKPNARYEVPCLHCKTMNIVDAVQTPLAGVEGHDTSTLSKR